MSVVLGLYKVLKWNAVLYECWREMRYCMSIVLGLYKVLKWNTVLYEGFIGFIQSFGMKHGIGLVLYWLCLRGIEVKYGNVLRLPKVYWSDIEVKDGLVLEFCWALLKF